MSHLPNITDLSLLIGDKSISLQDVTRAIVTQQKDTYTLIHKNGIRIFRSKEELLTFPNIPSDFTVFFEIQHVNQAIVHSGMSGSINVVNRHREVEKIEFDGDLTQADYEKLQSNMLIRSGVNDGKYPLYRNWSDADKARLGKGYTTADSRGTAVLDRIRVLEAEIKRDEQHVALGERMEKSGSQYDPDRKSKLYRLYLTHPGLLSQHNNDVYQLIHQAEYRSSCYIPINMDSIYWMNVLYSEYRRDTLTIISNNKKELDSLQ